jgi:hypothetical protein
MGFLLIHSLLLIKRSASYVFTILNWASFSKQKSISTEALKIIPYSPPSKELSEEHFDAGWVN